MKHFSLKFCLSILILTLTACSSTEKAESDDQGAGSDSASVESNSSGTKSVDESFDDPKPAAKAPPTPAQASNALDEAYKSGDDGNLQRIAAELLAQNPADAKAHHALGVINYKRGRFLAAMYYFNKALQHNAKMSEVHTNIGLTHLALDDRREAIRSFKKAMEMNSSDAAAAANLGSIYTAEGDYTKAQIALDRAIKAGIRDARIYNNYGIALTGLGKFEDAKDIYKEAVKLDRNNRDSLFNLAILQIDHLNDFGGGLESLNQLRFLGLADGMRERINALENKAKAGSNK